jgi:tape measure domain-containing protein
MLGVSQAAQDGARQAATFDSAMAQAGTSIGGAMELSSGFSGALLTIGQGMQNAGAATGEFFQHARELRSEFTMIGGAMAVVGGGMTALMGSVINTGIQYNTLQQVAGRAMETMAGSASAAADQMDRLHEFADTSPFARDTWITAQQQLMAFGMEAERVVPTLEGVQNAVAAIGGGDQEIMQLVDILGQIEGQGRITGRELQRLGQMGINAADLIGDAMGVSGNEIREQITNGALDAETAITALTDGMMMRFDGAAEGLRDTMTGALDRVSARVRDLGSVLAAPLVNPEGGGFLVEAINMAADFGSALLDLPDPLLQIAGLTTTAAGGALLLGSAFFMAAPRVFDFVEGIGTTIARMRDFSAAHPGMTRGLRGIGMAAGVAAVAVAGFAALRWAQDLADGADHAARSASQLEQEFLRLSTTGDSLGAAFEGIRLTDDEFLGFSTQSREAENLGEALEYVRRNGEGASTMFGNFSARNRDVAAITEEVEALDEVLSGMVASGDLQGTIDTIRDLGLSGQDISEYFPQARDAILEAATAAGVGASEMEILAWIAGEQVMPAALEAAGGVEALENAINGVGDEASGAEDPMFAFGGALGEMAEAAQEASDALSEIVDAYTALGLIQVDAQTQIGNYHAALRELNDELEEHDGSLNLATESGQGMWDLMSGLGQQAWDTAEGMAEAGYGVDEVTRYLEGANEELAEAIEGMHIGEDQARTLGEQFGWSAERIEELADGMGLGADEAQDLADMLLLIPPDVSSEFEFFDEFGREAVESTQRLLEDFPEEVQVWFEAQDQHVQDAIAALIEGDYSTLVDILGDSSTAEMVMEAFIAGDYETIAEILAVDDQARAVIEALMGGNYEAVTQILGEDGPARAVIDAFTRGDYEAVAQILGDDDHAVQTIFEYMHRDYWTTVDIDGNGNPFLSEMSLLEGANYNAVITATANTSGAERILNWAARARTATVTLQAHTGGAASAIGRAMAGGASGRRASSADFASAMALPAFSIGGRLPSTGLGTDSILGLSRSGTPTAWVDDREWIINRQSSDKYDGLLRMINADHPAIRGLSGFATGGRPREFAASSAPPPVAAMVGASGGDQRPVNFNFHTVNPIAEPQSRTAQRSMEAIGMGWAPDEMGGPHG